MKNYVIALLLIVSAMSAAQIDVGFGVNAGLNYGSTGDLTQDGRTINDNPDAKLGYHVGVYGKIGAGPVFFRPELLYTKLTNEYNGVQFDLEKIDAPLLVGFNLPGPFHFFAGPSLQYIIDTELEDFDVDDAMDNFSVGGQIGVGVSIGNLGIDVRYERSLTENEASFINNNVGLNRPITIDTRQQQIILSVSVKI